MRSNAHRAPMLGLALAAVVGLGSGCNWFFGLDETILAPDDPDPNAYTCECTCFEGTREQLVKSFGICFPDGDADLSVDCDTRVKATWLGILHECGSTQIQKLLTERGESSCTCAPSEVRSFAPACDGPCQSVPLDPSCSNQDEASQVGTLPPLCLAEPPDGGAAQRTIGSALFDGRSTCEVSGTLTVARTGEDSLVRSAAGTFEFYDEGCTASGCDLGMVYRVDEVGSFGFSSFAGFASVSIEGISVFGGSIEPATLDALGNGEYGAEATSSGGHGTRVDEEFFGADTDITEMSYYGTNSLPVSVGFDRANAVCEVVGALFQGEIEGAENSISLHVGGALVNRPPVASIGGSAVVECTSVAGAAVALDDASADPDGDDIAFREWRLGGPGGEPLDASSDGGLDVYQGLGTTVTYALNVIDSHSEVSQDVLAVSVVDSTPPAITAIEASPSVLHPLNHRMVPVTVTVAASDVCGTATCAITDVTANQPVDGLGDGDTEVDWEITGPLTVDLRAESSGVIKNRIYTIHVECTDGTNGAPSSVEVTVPVNR